MGKYNVVISNIVTDKLNGCSEEKRLKLLDYLAQINYEFIQLPEKGIEIAGRIVNLNILKKKRFDDCQNIAASINSKNTEIKETPCQQATT
jgi:hypothetical protein